MESNLNGIYRVSFDIEVEAKDALALSDLAQSLTEGILSEGLAAKVSHLSLEKIEKHGKAAPKQLKIGDMVQLTSDIQIIANVYSDDGYFFIGKTSTISECIAENQTLILSAGSYGFVNKVSNGIAEIIDIDKAIIEAKFEDVGIDAINVDMILLDASLLEKIDAQEGK